MDKCKSRGTWRSCFTIPKADRQRVAAGGLCLFVISVSAASEQALHSSSTAPGDTQPAYNRDPSGWQVVGGETSNEVRAAGNSDSLTGVGANSGLRVTSRVVSEDDEGWYQTTIVDSTSDDNPVERSQAVGASAERRNSRTTPLELVQPLEPYLSSSPATINLDLFVGEVKVLDNIDVKRVAVGNGSIVRAEVIDTGELLLIATSAGSSSIRLWNTDGSQTDYNLRVSETDRETRVHMQRIVRMRVRMVEFRKSALGRLGIDWSDSARGPAASLAGEVAQGGFYRPDVQGLSELPSGVAPFSTYFGVASNITSRINFLAQNGDAVTLAEPVLSAMNGGEASFLAGGEVPYPTVGENGLSQVEFKEYGVMLNVAPLIDSAGNVRAKLETEISQLDSSVSVQGTPGLLTRRAQTEVTVRSGETIVISGLLSSESSTDVDMLPGLGRLPIIGRFFSSRGQRNAVSELVIFITPEVIEPGQAAIDSRERLYFSESDKRVDTLRQQLPLME